MQTDPVDLLTFVFIILNLICLDNQKTCININIFNCPFYLFVWCCFNMLVIRWGRDGKRPKHQNLCFIFKSFILPRTFQLLHYFLGVKFYFLKIKLNSNILTRQIVLSTQLVYCKRTT